MLDVFLDLASCSPPGIVINEQSESSGFSLYLLVILHIYRGGGGGRVIPPSLLLVGVERLRSGTTELHWCDWRWWPARWKVLRKRRRKRLTVRRRRPASPPFCLASQNLKMEQLMSFIFCLFCYVLLDRIGEELIFSLNDFLHFNDIQRDANMRCLMCTVPGYFHESSV